MPKKHYKIIISEKASQMLYFHIKFLAKVNIEASKKLRDIIIKEIEKLSENAEMYNYLNDPILPLNKYHKKIISKRYLIIYQIKNNTVYVDYIIDCRTDYKWLLS